MDLHDATMSAYQSTQRKLEEVGLEVSRVARGILAGAISGAIAAYVMNRYQEIEDRPLNVRRNAEPAGSDEPALPSPGIAPQNVQAPDRDPKVLVAQQVSRQLFEHELGDFETKVAGPIVHYGYAAAAGALYGGLAEVIPAVGMGFGIPYATLLLIGGPTIALPALGVAPPLSEMSAPEHASGLAKHFVYGISLDIGRRILRHIV